MIKSAKFWICLYLVGAFCTGIYSVRRDVQESLARWPDHEITPAEIAASGYFPAVIWPIALPALLYSDHVNKNRAGAGCE